MCIVYGILERCTSFWRSDFFHLLLNEPRIKELVALARTAC